MLNKELLLHYEKEVQYQKHMLNNLGRWFTLFFALASIGVSLTYFFYQGFFPLFFLGLFMILLGVIGMLLFGYGIYKGRANLHKTVDYMEMQLSKKKYQLQET